MAEQGWMGLIVPDTYGGVGMTYLDLIILIEEFGRALVAGPVPARTASPPSPSSRPRSEDQKQAYLPAIAAGTQVWTLAHTEPSARFDAEGVAAHGDQGRRRLRAQRHEALRAATATSPTRWSS